MRNTNSIAALFGLSYLLIVLDACKKEAPTPFRNDDDTEQTNPDSVAPPDPKSFAGLQYYIFKPTCANSGCHDGTFEPDFRTIQSSYNTLVYRPIIKNNPQNSFTFRVVPYQPDASVLINRLTVDIDGLSGIMPLITDPNAEWSLKKEEHIQNIRDWILNGAKDVFGQVPQPGNREPQLLGIMVTPVGSTTPYPRSGTNAVDVIAGVGSVDVWIAVGDDSTAASALGSPSVKFSGNPYDYSSASGINLQTVPGGVSNVGFSGDMVQFTHKATYSIPTLFGDTTIFFRSYFQDPKQPGITEMPESGSLQHVLDYCSFKLSN